MDEYYDEYYTMTKAQMEVIQKETAAKLRKLYPKTASPEPSESKWTTEDILNMSIQEYEEARKDLMVGVSLMTPDELRTAEEIPKPPPPPQPWHFKSF